MRFIGRVRYTGEIATSKGNGIKGYVLDVVDVKLGEGRK